MWDYAIVICYGKEREIAVRAELNILSTQNLLPSKHFLVVGASEHYGRGSSFLNAMLLVAERLCQTRNISSVSGELLDGLHILVIDEGNHCCFWPYGNILLTTSTQRPNGSGLATYLEYLMHTCIQLKNGASPGVWVVFCDFLVIPSSVNLSQVPMVRQQDAVVFTTDSISKFSKFSGMVKCNINKNIEEITLNEDEDVQLETTEESFAGIVYLKQSILKILGSMVCEFPTTMCTYLAEDMGHTACKISFYDLIAPLLGKGSVAHESEPQHTRRKGLHIHDEIDNSRADVSIRIRGILWDKLHRFKASTCTLPGLEFIYLTMQERVVDVLSKSMLNAFAQTDLPHSILPRNSKVIAVDSILDTRAWSDCYPESTLIASKLWSSNDTSQTLLNKNSYLIGVNLCIDEIPSSFIDENCCLVSFCIELNQKLTEALAVFSVQDAPALDMVHPRATVFGLGWGEYLQLKRIDVEDLWSSDQPKSLLTAKFYPIVSSEDDWMDLLWIRDVRVTVSRVQSWRAKQRLSISDLIELTNHVEAIRTLRDRRATSLLRAVERRSYSILPFLPRALAEGWLTLWLDFLDIKAINASSEELPRLFINISEVLAFMAGKDGILRSGPAMHKDWMTALSRLESRNIKAGVQGLSCERLKWMNTPERLIRAARHYERAAQIMVKLTIDNVQKYMPPVQSNETIYNRPGIGAWIESECPVRLDLAGGWSDTPPVCYEIGGVVINVSILIDGKRPIVARGRRIDEMKLVLGSSNLSQPLSITSIEQLDSITDPSTPGALIKAALLAARVIDIKSGTDLPSQLNNVLGSGLELHVWSNVPQGSGLGTSSILAGALLACIYTAMGVDFTRSHLVHAVLLMEQLMTTGGGWQDQVSGIFGGCNKGYSLPNPDVRIFADKIALSSAVADDLNSRLFVLFTGQARLARNLLQGVIRKWYTRDQATVECFQQLVLNAGKCQTALENGNIAALGEALTCYWSQKKHIAPGCEPRDVKIFMDHMDPFVYGQSLAGAGGGGFYFALLKDPIDQERCKGFANQFLGKGRWYAATLDCQGITLSLDGCMKEIQP